MPQIVEERRTRTSDNAAETTPEQSWRGQPVTAGLLRVVLFLVPPAVALAVTTTLYRLIETPGGLPGRVGLWLVLLVVGFLVVVTTERFARRFLPVTMLMRLTVVFPDQAPSRYKVLRQAASPARLKEIAESDGESAGPAVQVLALVAQLARHDKHTRGHSERVRVFSDLIADELGITGLDRDKLRWSALLHDIGKMDVPPEILNKNGRPTQDEWAVLQGHPAAGRGRAVGLAEWLGPWAGGIAEHHERWDGQGYPDRLGGLDITLAGRIVAVADAYETMTAARSYKKPMATKAARQELADCAGSQFDPRVVRAFLAVSLPKLLWKTGPLSFLVHLPFLGQLQAAGSQLASGSAQVAGSTVLAGLAATAVVTGLSPLASAAAPLPVASASVQPVPEVGAAQPAAPSGSTGPADRAPAPSAVPVPKADSGVLDAELSGTEPAVEPLPAAAAGGAPAAPAPAGQVPARRGQAEVRVRSAGPAATPPAAPSPAAKPAPAATTAKPAPAAPAAKPDPAPAAKPVPEAKPDPAPAAKPAPTAKPVPAAEPAPAAKPAPAPKPTDAGGGGKKDGGKKRGGGHG